MRWILILCPMVVWSVEPPPLEGPATASRTGPATSAMPSGYDRMAEVVTQELESARLRRLDERASMLALERRVRERKASIQGGSSTGSPVAVQPGFRLLSGGATGVVRVQAALSERLTFADDAGHAVQVTVQDLPLAGGGRGRGIVTMRCWLDRSVWRMIGSVERVGVLGADGTMAEEEVVGWIEGERGEVGMLAAKQSRVVPRAGERQVDQVVEGVVPQGAVVRLVLRPSAPRE